MANDALLPAAAAVYGLLSGDAALGALVPGGVWPDRAPVDVETYPLMTVALLPSRIDSTFAGPYRWVFDLRITTLDKAESFDAAGAASDRAFTLLQDADDTDLPMAGFDVLFCRKQSGNKMSPVREGEQFQQLIDGYRLEVRPGT